MLVWQCAVKSWSETGAEDNHMVKSEISKAAQSLAVAERKLVKLAESVTEQTAKLVAKLDTKYDKALGKINDKVYAKTQKAAAAVAAAKKALTDLVAQA